MGLSVKTIGNLAKKLPVGELNLSKAAAESPVRRTLQQTDKLLKDTGLRLQGELPMDQFLARIPKAQRKGVASLLGNPETVQFAAKHNPNGRFSIFGFLYKKGGKTVGKGALSITDFGQPNAVAKWKISTGAKGKNLQVNGFADCAGTATPQEVSMVPSIGRMLGLDAKAGTVAAQHIKVDGAKLARVLPEETGRNILGVSFPKPKIDQPQIDKFLQSIRKNIGA